MKVTTLQAFYAPAYVNEYVIAKGIVVDVPEPIALQWVEQGLATPVIETATTQRPHEQATTKKRIKK